MTVRATIALVLVSTLCCPFGHTLRAEEAECTVVSGGAETDALTGSIQNAGQVVIGPAAAGSVVLHAGAIPCLAVHIDCLPGDVNGDGLIDGLDIGRYVDVTLTGIGTPRELCAAAIDEASFVELLLAG